MKSKKPWEDRIAAALLFGDFISWREISYFREELDRLAEDLEPFCTEKPQKARPVIEIFIAACLEKGQEIDDSGNDLGMFLDELFLAWTRCCQAAELSPEEYIRKLAHWKKVDEIGYCSDLERTVIPSLDKNYRKALQEALKTKSQAGDRESGRALKKLYLSTKNTKSFIAFCEKHGTTPEDCLALAGIFHSRKEYAQGLEWIEKGLRNDSPGNWRVHELKDLRRKILKDSGRGDEAVADAWMEFERSPSIYSLQDILESASKKDHGRIKSQALPYFDKVDLSTALTAFHDLGELARLVQRLTDADDKDLEEISYTKAIPIAKTLTGKHPIEAARLYISQAMVILGEKRSKAYHHAHDYLAEAKTLLEHSDAQTLWENTVARIRREHRLKSSFMPGFERIAAGQGAPREPTLMERIANKIDHD